MNWACLRGGEIAPVLWRTRQKRQETVKTSKTVIVLASGEVLTVMLVSKQSPHIFIADVGKEFKIHVFHALGIVGQEALQLFFNLKV